MNKDDIICMARKASTTAWCFMPTTLKELEHFAALVAQRERDELTVMFLQAHESAKDNHNYWHIAANKIKEKA